MPKEEKKKIKFSQHAILRAKERKLMRYLNKEIFYYDAKLVDISRAAVGECVYAFDQKDGKTVITTMYKVPLTV